MARFFGTVGYEIQEEIEDGVFKPKIVTRQYYGDVERVTRTWEASQNGINDDLDIRNDISIVADAFAYQHFHQMKYVEWYGAKWKVKSVEVMRPRLILSIGGVYHDAGSETPGTAC